MQSAIFQFSEGWLTEIRAQYAMPMEGRFCIFEIYRRLRKLLPYLDTTNIIGGIF